MPDHCENSPKLTRISKRWRLPGVAHSSLHDVFSNSCSSAIVCWISLNSTLTSSSFWSPCAWYLYMICFAFSCFPFAISQRGDSGTNQMKKIWNSDGIACSRHGARHAQSPTMLFVPKLTHAPMSEPRYHSVL